LVLAREEAIYIALLYVKTTTEEKRIPIAGSKKGIISNRTYEGSVILGPQEADLVWRGRRWIVVSGGCDRMGKR